MTSAPPVDEERVAHATGDESALPLPPTRRRRARRRRSARRRRLARLVRWVGGGAVVGVVLVAAVVAAVRDGGPRPAATGRAPARATAGTDRPAGAAAPTALLVQQDGDRVVSVNLLAVAPTGRGGHVVLIPPGTMAEIPGFGLDAVGTAGALGGPALLQAGIENLLGAAVGDTVVVDAAGMAGLVRPAGDLTVDVPERVEEVGPGGGVEVVWEPGPALVGPDDLERLLVVPGDGGDLARMARHQAFWRAWLARLRAEPGAVPAPPADHGLGPVLAALARGDVAVDLLPVEAVDAGGTELYRPLPDEVEALVRAALPATARAAARPRVQVLNGTGEVGLAQRVTVRLVQPPLRARVLYTGNAASFDHDVTQVVFYDRADQALAARVRAALGVGRLVLGRRPLGIVDVTVVVGRDFR
jgi:hypothetical protein